MKKQIKTGLLIAALAVGITVNNVMAADTTTCPCKMAVVEVTRVVAQSSEVQALKTEQQQKLTELQKWLETVRADVEKQQTKEGKEKLIKKYDADFAKKQEAIKKDYTARLEKIDKDITAVIYKEAKAKGYTMVFAKGTVLYGGDDITNDIIKLVK